MYKIKIKRIRFFPGDRLRNPSQLLTISPRHRTCAARVVAHSQRVSVVIRVHGEQADSEGAVLGVRSAVFKVFQVDAELVVALDGQGVDLLQPCSKRETVGERQRGWWLRSQGKLEFRRRTSAAFKHLLL